MEHEPTADDPKPVPGTRTRREEAEESELGSDIRARDEEEIENDEQKETAPPQTEEDAAS